MKTLAFSAVVALSIMATGCNSKQATESDNQETSVYSEYYDTSSESYSTPSYSGSYSSRDEVDEMYDGVADETKAHRGIHPRCAFLKLITCNYDTLHGKTNGVTTSPDS